MIKSEILEKKWSSINQNDIDGYRFIRLTKESKPELNIGWSSHGRRCLILELPENFYIDINSVNKDNISIQYFKKNNYLVIELLNFDYKDLFNDLILSLYNKVKDLSVPQEYANKFILTISKWIDFFENRTSELSEEQIRGLFGELFVLNNYLKDSDASNINSVLDSWKGLYDAANDFEFDLKNVEIKTKNENIPHVKISSEFQLNQEFDKGLELILVTLKSDYINGKSLHDLVLIIIGEIRKKFGDLRILYEALKQKNLSVKNIQRYNNHRFSVVRTEVFDAARIDFPKLSKSNIPEQVSNLKYYLRINQLDQFLIDSKDY